MNLLGLLSEIKWHLGTYFTFILQVEIWYQNRRTQLKKESTENSKFHQSQILNEQESNLQHLDVLQTPATKNRAPVAAIEVKTEQEVPSDQGRKNSGKRKFFKNKRSFKNDWVSLIKLKCLKIPIDRVSLMAFFKPSSIFYQARTVEGSFEEIPCEMSLPFFGLDNKASKTSASKYTKATKTTWGQSVTESAPERKAVFSVHQLLELEKQFNENGVLCQPKRREVCTHLGLPERQVLSAIMFFLHFTIFVAIAVGI